jgi:hypothetical protein
MSTRRRVMTVAGGIFGIVLAGYTHVQAGPPSDNPPPDDAPLVETDPFPGGRTASGIDLNSVECAHVWAFAVKSYLDRCNPDGDTELKEDLDYEIKATAEFFNANNSHPEATKRLEELRHSANMAEAPKSTFDLLCSASPDNQQNGLFKAYSNMLRAMPRDERRAKVAKLLTVPGPALNMCFP